MIASSPFLTFENLERMTWLRHCFTTRRFEEQCPAEWRARPWLAARLMEEHFRGARAAVWGSQVHGSVVAQVSRPRERLIELPGVDGLVCAETGICLVAWAADCPVVFIADPERKAIALVHSGRKGTEERIVTSCLEEMLTSFGTVAADCVAAIGPSIGPCCYPVDLWERLDKELADLGVKEIVNPRICTSCHPELFFSYRRDKGIKGRMLAAAMITP